MTRINAGIPPEELSRRHLMAEHREIKRIPNLVRQGRVNLDAIPPTFRLGKGHVSFFYDKLGYLHERYLRIHNECCLRGYNVQDYSGAWNGIDPKLMGYWKPSEQDAEIIRKRINERLGGVK